MRDIKEGKIMTSDTSSKILRTVPREKAFYFFTSIGNYTGTNASSLKEFMEKIDEVNVKSLEFHLNRGDLERWVAEVLEDKRLATDIGRLQKSNLSGVVLRVQLYSAVSTRHKELVAKPSFLT